MNRRLALLGLVLAAVAAALLFRPDASGPELASPDAEGAASGQGSGTAPPTAPGTLTDVPAAEAEEGAPVRAEAADLLRLRVRAQGGQPVDATVYLLPRLARESAVQDEAAPEVERRDAPGGLLELPRTDGAVELLASGPEGRSGVLALDPDDRGDAAPRVVVLDHPHGRVVLHLRDAGGAPVADGMVEVVGFRAETDHPLVRAAAEDRFAALPAVGADGTWRTMLPAGSYRLRAEDGAGRLALMDLRVAEGEEVERSLVLGATAELVGRVVGADGRPAAGAEVIAYPTNGLTTPRTDPTLVWFQAYGSFPDGPGAPFEDGLVSAADRDGRFRLLVPAGWKAYPLLRAEGLRSWVGPAVELEEGARHDLGTVRLDAGGELRVRVLADGAPAAGAAVGWEPPDSLLLREPPARSTDAEGWADFHAVAPGRVRVRAVLPGRAPTESEARVVDGETTEVVLELEPGGRVVGRVTRAGAPVGGARVRLLPHDPDSSLQWLLGDSSRGLRTETGDDGAFVLADVPAGRWDLIAGADEAEKRVTGLQVTAGADTAVDVDLAGGAELTVTVLDQDDLPRAGEAVSAVLTEVDANRQLRTGPDGRAVFRDLEPGLWTVIHVSGADAATTEAGDLSGLRVEQRYVRLAEGERAEVVLGGRRETADLVGRVTAGGEPRPGLTVMAVGPGGTRVERTDEAGGFRFDAMPLGPYLLIVAASLLGGDQYQESVELIEAGETRHDVELPERGLEVVVRDAESGAPLEGVAVSLRPADGSHPSGGLFATTDGEGTARFSWLVPGAYDVVAGPLSLPLFGGSEGGNAILPGIEVADAPGTQRVELRLGQGATLRVRVRTPDGGLVRGAHLFYEDAEGRPLNVLSMKATNSKGVAQLEGLPPGPGVLLVRHPELGLAQVPVRLAEGVLVKQEVVLDPGGFLEVQPVGDAGEPLPGVWVVVLDDDGRPVSTRWSLEETQEVRNAYLSGTPYRVGPLAPGTYRVRLVRPGRPPVDHEVVLPPGTEVERVTVTWPAD